jgi:hypothetical protein
VVHLHQKHGLEPIYRGDLGHVCDGPAQIALDVRTIAECGAQLDLDWCEPGNGTCGGRKMLGVEGPVVAHQVRKYRV